MQNITEQFLLSNSTTANSQVFQGDYIVRLTLTLLVLILAPGNLLVISVYAFNLTTSTRMYMFNLACTDTLICGIAVFLGGVLNPKLSKFYELPIVFVYNVALFNSMFVLTLIAVERLYCIKRPLEYKFSEPRAKYGMTALLLLSSASSGALMLGRLYISMWRPVRLYLMLVVTCCFLVMCVAYSIMARLMLKRAAQKRRKAAALMASRRRTSSVTSSTEVTSSAASDVTNSEEHSAEVGVSNPPIPPETRQPRRMKISMKPDTKKVHHKLTAPQRASIKRTRKSIRVMLAITLAFVICWSPIGAICVGFEVHPALAYLFIMNSVINPVIYSFMSSMFRKDVVTRFQCLRIHNSKSSTLARRILRR